jgi:hypothetical protein
MKIIKQTEGRLNEKVGDGRLKDGLSAVASLFLE